MTTEPTDEELRRIAKDCGLGWAAGLGGMDDFLRDFARAVLARWGQPAGREPLTQDQALDAFCRTPGIHQLV